MDRYCSNSSPRANAPDYVKVNTTMPRMETAMGNQPINVMVVDDHTMVRRGIRVFLDEYEDIFVIGEAADGVKAVELVEEIKPDVVLVDLLMPGMDGIETISRILAIQPDLHILVLTASIQDEKFLLAIQAGALGYLKKDATPEELVESIQKVHAGKPAIDPAMAWRVLHGGSDVETANPIEVKLSNRETEVLRLLTEGHTDHEIAKLLFVTDVTVRTHVARILMKLGLKNRVQAVLYGLRTGVAELEAAKVWDEDID